MKSMVRMALRLLAAAIGVGIVFNLLFVVLVHVLSGDSSPGILVVAKRLSAYWIPLFASLCLLWFIVTFGRIFWQARKRASAAGLSVGQYFDLTPTQKSQLGDEENSARLDGRR
jgi:hypothetical protein